MSSINICSKDFQLKDIDMNSKFYLFKNIPVVQIVTKSKLQICIFLRIFEKFFIFDYGKCVLDPKQRNKKNAISLGRVN